MRSDYVGIIKVIEKEFGDLPLEAADGRTRRLLKERPNKRVTHSRPQADYGWTVLARILSVAKNRGQIAATRVSRGGRLYRSSRVGKIWTFDDEAAFLRHAPAHLHLPLLLALRTGQRQGDLLQLRWSAYDGSVVRLRPSKSKRRLRPRRGCFIQKLPLTTCETNAPICRWYPTWRAKYGVDTT